MSYDAREELLGAVQDELSDNEALAMTLPPLGSEGISTSNAGRADETEFEEIMYVCSQIV